MARDPIQLEDALDVINYVTDHPELYYADMSKMILGGLSSGANIAAVSSNVLRTKTKVKLFHQLLRSGAYDYTNSLHDYDEYAFLYRKACFDGEDPAVVAGLTLKAEISA